MLLSRIELNFPGPAPNFVTRLIYPQSPKFWTLPYSNKNFRSRDVSHSQIHCTVLPMWRKISLSYTSPLYKSCAGFPQQTFTNLTVELVIAVWGQSTMTPDTSAGYTRINKQPQGAEFFRYPQSSILSAHLCLTAVSVFSLSLLLTFVSRLDL
jgi:hypothetical protein